MLHFFKRSAGHFSGIKIFFFNGSNLPLLLILAFPLYFAYDLYMGNIVYAHPDLPGMYFPFRQWFLDSLLHFKFPFWNPYWGCGLEAVIWSTVPLDPYTLVEWILGPRYEYFYLIQCSALVLAAYFTFRKMKLSSLAAATGSLLFFLSPLITYWYLEFVKTNIFIAHVFNFFLLVKWFETGKCRYPALFGWVFFLGMFGTKLEFWFFETVFFGLLALIAFWVYRPGSFKKVIALWMAIAMAVVAQAWQINLLLNALDNSVRLAIPHGLANLFSSELYRNLFLSLRDTDFIPAALMGLTLFGSIHQKRFRWVFFPLSLILAILLKVWDFEFLKCFLLSPLFLGALAATGLSWRHISKKHLASTWVLFMLAAYYWCKPLGNHDESYLLKLAPFLFRAVWGFLVWLGCFAIHRNLLLRLAYLSVVLVLLLENQGQILLSYISGYVWISGRDSYLIDFSFAVIAAYGAAAPFRHRKWLAPLLPLLIMFSSCFNRYYVAPFDPIPGIANPLLNYRIGYSPFQAVPDLKAMIEKIRLYPSQRVLDPDIDHKLPQNQGTFLYERMSNANLYGSMNPKRYSELVAFRALGVLPEENISGYPSIYGDKVLSRLPKTKTKNLSNQTIYYYTVWANPPIERDLLRLMGITHIVTRNESLLTTHEKSLGLRDFQNTGDFNSAEIPDALPRSFSILNIDAKNINDLQKNMRPAIELVRDVRGPQEPGAFLAEPAKITTYEPEYVSIESDIPKESFLVLTDVFHPYWQAFVDGKKSEITPAFHAFRAVRVPAGPHKVEFVCRVPHVKTAFLISAFLLVTGIVLTPRLWHRTLSPGIH